MWRSSPGTAPQWMRFTRWRSPPAAATMARPVSAHTITPIIMAPSCLIPTATTSRPSATRRRKCGSCRNIASSALLSLGTMERSMSDDNVRNVDRAWELMKKIGFAMLVTRDGDRLRARPMSAYLERNENAIYFLTDARRHKDEEIAKDPSVNLSFADASSQKYVSGTAVISNDRGKIRELFSTPA